MASFSGQRLLDDVCNLIDRGLLTELGNLSIIGNLMQTHALRETTLSTQIGRDFALCEQQELKHEVVALFRPAADARLAHENEAGYQDRLKGKDGVDQRKREGIEVN